MFEFLNFAICVKIGVKSSLDSCVELSSWIFKSTAHLFRVTGFKIESITS